jgi:hypothetical protein
LAGWLGAGSYPQAIGADPEIRAVKITQLSEQPIELPPWKGFGPGIVSRLLATCPGGEIGRRNGLKIKPMALSRVARG